MLLNASLVWPCCMDMRDSALNARQWHVALMSRGMSKVAVEKHWRGRCLESDQERAWWETCGTFCEGELALIVLNKEKIRFNFLQSQHRRPTPTGRNLFSIFSILSFLVVISYCTLQARYHQSKTCAPHSPQSQTSSVNKRSITGPWWSLVAAKHERDNLM